MHGNGGATGDGLWLPSVKEELVAAGIDARTPTMPDNVQARENRWLPFLAYTLHVDEHSILVGHSSGAVAAMRYAEASKIYGSVLIGASYTDLGDGLEKKSGYFDRPWDWERIKENQQWIIQFASTDDPYIPIEEARHIHGQLSTEYYEDTDQGHYMQTDFPRLVDVIKEKVAAAQA